jgi:hypothetical protein
MSNVLNNLMPDAFAALDVVSRELVGILPAVARDATADRAALNQVIRDPVTPSNTTSDITPAMAVPTPGGQTIGNKTLSITKSKFAAFSWSGDEQQQVNAGPGVLTIQQDQIAQAIRALVNEMEADLTGLHISASRAYGTAGTTPFASDLSDPAQVRKILDDNGAPVSDRHMIIDTTAGAKMRTLAQLTKANESADTTMLRQGALLDIHGFTVRESAQVKVSTAGTAAGSTTTAAGFAVGTTSIPLASAGTGTFVAGDIITIAGDTANKYVLVSGDTDVSNGGTLVIADPGLRKAIPASATAITVVGAATRNLAFTRNALALACRLPALPTNGDLATDRTKIIDPRSGIAFELAYYPGFRMGGYFIGAAWGTACMKPEHLALLLG